MLVLKGKSTANVVRGVLFFGRQISDYTLISEFEGRRFTLATKLLDLGKMIVNRFASKLEWDVNTYMVLRSTWISVCS